MEEVTLESKRAPFLARFFEEVVDTPRPLGTRTTTKVRHETPDSDFMRGFHELGTKTKTEVRHEASDTDFHRSAASSDASRGTRTITNTGGEPSDTDRASMCYDLWTTTLI